MSTIGMEISISVAIAIVAVWGVVTQRVLARRIATVEYIFNLLNDHDFIKARAMFVKEAKSKEKLIPFAEIDNSDEESDHNHEVKDAIHLVLNNYELMAIGIQRGILDYKIIERYARAIIIQHWDAASPYIMRLRIVKNNENYYSELEAMKNWMSKSSKPHGKFWSLFF